MFFSDSLFSIIRAEHHVLKKAQDPWKRVFKSQIWIQMLDHRFENGEHKIKIWFKLNWMKHLFKITM